MYEKSNHINVIPCFHTTYFLTLVACFDVENFGRDHKIKVCMYQVQLCNFYACDG